VAAAEFDQRVTLLEGRPPQNTTLTAALRVDVAGCLVEHRKYSQAQERGHATRAGRRDRSDRTAAAISNEEALIRGGEAVLRMQLQSFLHGASFEQLDPETLLISGNGLRSLKR